MKNTKEETVLTAEELKEMLCKIMNEEKDWSAEQERLLIASMLEHIGSTDSELRDSCIYGTFCKLTLEKRLDEELLKGLLDVCLSDHMLFSGIGDAGSDLVFTRSFTSLLIALILYSDNESSFLTEDEVSRVKEKLILYVESEKDFRGFVPAKGWAHSIAHAADAFDELAKNRFTDAKMHEELLNALWQKAFVSSAVYIHDEEERIIVPILEMLKSGMEPQIVERLLQQLPAEIHKQKEQLKEENYWFLIANAKKFLKSFYIMLEGDSELAGLQQSIKTCLLEL